MCMCVCEIMWNPCVTQQVEGPGGQRKARDNKKKLGMTWCHTLCCVVRNIEAYQNFFQHCKQVNFSVFLRFSTKQSLTLWHGLQVTYVKRLKIKWTKKQNLIQTSIRKNKKNNPSLICLKKQTICFRFLFGLVSLLFHFLPLVLFLFALFSFFSLFPRVFLHVRRSRSSGHLRKKKTRKNNQKKETKCQKKGKKATAYECISSLFFVFFCFYLLFENSRLVLFCFCFCFFQKVVCVFFLHCFSPFLVF